MNTRSKSGRDDEADPSRFGRKQLPSRNLVEEQLPLQARHAQGQIDRDMFATAVTIHNGVINPVTGLPWSDRPTEMSFVASCEDMVIECQNWTRKQCRPDDDNSLQRTTEALEATASAIDVMQNLETALDENVKDPRGGRSPAREVIANHKSDQALAADREREGDNRHDDKPVAHAWIVVAAGVLAVLDLMLLWRPVLQLAALDSAAMLFQWVVAGVLSAATALFIEITVRHYQRAERHSTDRRDAVRDRNRTVASDNHSALAERPPDLTQVDTADGKLRSAGGWLLGAAVATAVIGAARVAFLARGSGQSIVEAALFAIVAALFLGGLVVLMGFLSCRGNQLGDRLRIGTAVVEGVEQHHRQNREEVAEAREGARQLLVAADEAAAQGDETRAWVLEGYKRSMLLACRWCGLDRSVFAGVRLDACSRPLAEEAARKKDDTLAVLEVIDKWLATPQGIAERLRQRGTVPALAAAPGHAPARVRTVASPRDDQPSTVVPLESPLPEEPRISRRLMALGAAIAVATAVIVAILASPPEGDLDRQVIGSATVARVPASAAWAGSAAGTS